VTAALWVLGVLAAWTVAGLGAALVICRAIAIADKKEGIR
jgi:hypothetical protein